MFVKVIQMRTRDINFVENLGRKAWNDIYDMIRGTSKKKIFPLEKRIREPVKIQFILEAADENMDVNQYIAWLKKSSGTKTKYDYIINCWNEYPDNKEKYLLEQVLKASGGVKK